MFGLNKIIPIDSDYKFLDYRKKFYIVSGIAILISFVIAAPEEGSEKFSIWTPGQPVCQIFPNALE